MIKRATYAIPSLALASLSLACGGNDGDNDEVDPIINEFTLVAGFGYTLPYLYDDGQGYALSIESSTVVVDENLAASFTLDIEETYNGVVDASSYVFTGTFVAVEVGASYTITLSSDAGDVFNLECTMDADVNLSCVDVDDATSVFEFVPL